MKKIVALFQKAVASMNAEEKKEAIAAASEGSMKMDTYKTNGVKMEVFIPCDHAGVCGWASMAMGESRLWFYGKAAILAERPDSDMKSRQIQAWVNTFMVFSESKFDFLSHIIGRGMSYSTRQHIASVHGFKTESVSEDEGVL